MNPTFLTVMYEIALVTLPRVALKANPKIIGVLLQKDEVANTVQIHWGFSDKIPYRKWHNAYDIIIFRHL